MKIVLRIIVNHIKLLQNTMSMYFYNILFGVTYCFTIYSEKRFFRTINLIKSTRIDETELTLATCKQIRTINPREIIPARNVIFLANANVVVF